MGNEVAKVDVAGQIDEAVSKYSMAALGVEGFGRTLALAQGMAKLRRLVNGEVLETLSTLAGTDLGFRTDKDKDKGYPPAVVRDCLIEGMLRGAHPIGNEINIIAGRCYLTKAYFERVVGAMVNDLRIVEGVPHVTKAGALVPMQASWIMAGRADMLECLETETIDNRIPVRINAGMGIDAIIGKAYRKLHARIYRRVTGSTWLESSATEPEAVQDPRLEGPRTGKVGTP